MKYKHKKTGRIYNVISMEIINATNKDDGTTMVLYEGERRDGNGKAQFVRELNEFVVKFEPFEINTFDFVDACISSGKYVETGLNLPQTAILEIEDIIYRYNDTTAKTKIRKVIKNI